MLRRQLIKKRRRGLHIAHEAGVIERAGSRPAVAATSVTHGSLPVCAPHTVPPDRAAFFD